LIYNIPRVISHWTSEAKKYKAPCPHSCADPTSDKNDTNVEKTPQNVPVAKNPPKYTTACKVKQSNCRWHCKPTFFLGYA
jgi:hypothetical protein